MDRTQLTHFKAGDKVIWSKRVAGGDYVYPVSAVVIAVTAKRIKIEADDDRRMVIRHAPPESHQKRKQFQTPSLNGAAG